MTNMLARLLAAPLCFFALQGPSPAAADPCGDLGPRGQPRRQLAVLGCLTAIAAASDARTRPLSAKIERGFREVYLDLCAQPLLDDEAAAWTELYRLSARFYPRKQELASDVPMAFVNGHHHSLPHWVERSLRTPLGTLVHFDTHSDMEGIPRPSDVQAAINDLKAGRRRARAWHVLAHAAHRNAMPVTGAVLAAGVRDIVWAKPGWATAPVDFMARAFFYARPKGLADPRPLEALEQQSPAAFSEAFKAQKTDFFMLHYDPADNGERWLPRREREPETWQVAGAKSRPHEGAFDHLTPIRFSVLTTGEGGVDHARLAAAIEGERFVLDVDLDYFVNAGVGGDVEGSDDPASPGERAVLRREEPDSSAAIFHHRNYRAAAAAEERRVIERRIRRFRDALRALQKAGKQPSIVTIADSPNLPFSTAAEGQEHADFVPTHHAYWVHERVVAAIREVYGDGRPSGLGEAPTTVALPAPRARGDQPVLGADHEAFEKVRVTIRDALFGALAWASGAATTHQKTPQLSAYLSILHAIAVHGPDAELRRAARAVAEVHAQLTLEATAFGPSMMPTPAEAEEALRRVAFGLRYGAPEAEVTRAGARWLAATAGYLGEPDLDAASSPLPPSAAVALLGLRRAFAPGQELNLCDLFLGSQATDGGFSISDVPPLPRALFGLAAVRGILGLLPTAPVVDRPEATYAAGYPFGPADLRRAVLRGVAFATAVGGEQPATEPAIDALLLLRTATQTVGNEAARQLASHAGRLLAGRIATKASQLLASLSEAEQVPAFADLGRALAHFGIDVSAFRGELSSRATRFPTEQMLGYQSATSPTYADAHRALARAAVLADFGLGIDYGGVLRRALPMTAAATFTEEPGELIDRLNAVVQVTQTASAFRRARLDRASLPGEWRFLESLFDEVMGSRRVDLVAGLLEARRVLGDGPPGQRYLDLAWQLLHEQSRDGSWGRKGPEDQRLRTTWAALAALSELELAPTPPGLARTAAAVLRDRAAPPAVAPAPRPAGTAPASGSPARPGDVLGTGRSAGAGTTLPRVAPLGARP